jgi:RNA-directed DNA polymerase
MGMASPDDPSLDQYWAQRRRKTFSLLGGTTASALLRQHGRCPACGTFLLHAEAEPQSPREWEQWNRTITRALGKNALMMGTNDDGDRTTQRLIHAHCRQRERTQRQRVQPETQTRRPAGLA